MTASIFQPQAAWSVEKLVVFIDIRVVIDTQKKRKTDAKLIQIYHVVV